MTLLGVWLFGWEIDTSLFIFCSTLIGGFAWWLTAMYYDVHQMKKASEKRGRQLDIVIIKQEALSQTLGTEGVEFGKKFKHEYEKNVRQSMEEYKIEAA